MISDTESHVAAPKRRRKLTIQDIEAMAKLVATRKMSESEAAIMLDIKPHHWICWKSRNKHSATFETVITRTRANMIDGLVSKIEQAGDDQEIILPNGKIINKRGDWRAPAWLLEKTAPQFKPDNGLAPAPQVTVQIGIIHEQLKRVIGSTDVEQLSPKLLNVASATIKMPVRHNVA